MTEKEIQYEIRKAISQYPNIRLWRNNVGSMIDKKGQMVTFGLCPGSSDLIGLESIVITPDMIGKTMARFLAIEVKSEKGKASESQSKFLEMVRAMGGIGILARSVEDVHEIMD